jgi:hypothetical protein
MTEQDLIELGFKRIDDYNDGDGFHYYEYNICEYVDLDLVATLRDGNNWYVEFGCRFETEDKSKVKSLIDILNSFDEV